MKRIIFAALILFTVAANAQTVDLRRKIEVTGTAETEVTPDIIYFNISLKEYMDGRNRVTIETLEGQLEKALAAAGIPKENFTINNISGYATYQKKKDPNFLASKQYRIKFHDLNKVNQILSSVDPKGIESTYIESYDYSKMTELKQELKLKALIAAKEKATYLLNGIGEKLGGAIEITEEGDNNPSPMIRNLAFKANTLVAADQAAGDSDVDFKKIKLNFQIRAVFEIK